MAVTVSFAPWTRFTTPGGKPAWWTRSMTSCIAVGSCSDGLAIQQFPVATAYGQNQNCTMTGELNGLIPAKTPSGWRRTTSAIPAPPPPMLFRESAWRVVISGGSVAATPTPTSGRLPGEGRVEAAVERGERLRHGQGWEVDRREQADAVIEESRREEHEAVLEAGQLDRPREFDVRLFRPAGLHKIQRPHRAHAPDPAHPGLPFENLLPPVAG